MTVNVSVSWMRILRVAAWLVRGLSSVSMSCREANTNLPGFACASAVVGDSKSSRIAAIVLMDRLLSSRAELMGRVGDRPRRRDEISQRDPFVRSRPLLVD